MDDTEIWATFQVENTQSDNLNAREKSGMNLRSAQFYLLTVGEVDLASRIDPIIDALEGSEADDVH